MWKRLYRQLVTAKGRDIVHPPEPNIRAALHTAEEALDVRLPLHYKEFVRQFGPGVLADLFRIYAPVVRGSGCHSFDLVREQEELRARGFWAEKGRPSLVASLISFSNTLEGNTIFWDPHDVRNARTHDYGIYILPQNRSSGAVKELAGSFREFIEAVCLGHGYDRFGGPAGADGPVQQFRPAWRTGRLAGVGRLAKAGRTSRCSGPATRPTPARGVAPSSA